MSISTIEQTVSIGEINIDKVRIYSSAIMSNMFVYGTVGGMIMGGIIGGAVGSVFGPGGTVVGITKGAAWGAKVGTAIGGLVGLFKGKEKVREEKRQQIMKKVTDILRDSQNDLNTKIKLVIIQGKTELFKLFKNEVEAEKTKCNNILKGLDADSKQRELISSLKRECSLYDAQTAKLYNTITKV